MHFLGSYWIGHLLVAIVHGCLLDGVECLCVMFRTRGHVFILSPCMLWLYVHVQLCYVLRLACDPLVLELLRVWGVAVLE
jgi:hypothetical protein